MNTSPFLSIVIPFFNEEENVEAVLAEVILAQPEGHIIAVDDGSNDATWEKITRVHGVQGLRLPRHMGQSAALYSGIMAASGELVGTMDGDGQTDPADYTPMMELLRNEGVDAVIGYRAIRRDSWSKRVAARLANGVRNAVLRDGARDTGCPMKIFRRSARAALMPFDGMHRFMPALFVSAGFTLREMPVRHRARRSGKSRYSNWGRLWCGLHDLLGVHWLLKRLLVFHERGEVSATAREKYSFESSHNGLLGDDCPDAARHQA
jgi:dolichol-phosphate mannosyltransferase